MNIASCFLIFPATKSHHSFREFTLCESAEVVVEHFADFFMFTAFYSQLNCKVLLSVKAVRQQEKVKMANCADEPSAAAAAW